MEKVSARVEMRMGRPTLLINETPTSPILYSLFSGGGGQWSWEGAPAWNIRKFAEIGIHLHQVDLSLEDVWFEDGTVDISVARRQVRGVLDADPEAAVMIRFHVNAPYWWDRAHPDELTQYADAPSIDRTPISPYYSILSDNLNPLKIHSLASKKWRADAADAYKTFLSLLENTEEGDRVFSIQVADGVYGEWHWFAFLDHDPDVSRPMLEAFRDWLRVHRGEDAAKNAAIPDLRARVRTGDGVFRAPAEEQNVIDYYECMHDVVSDDILHFCRATKEGWSRPIVTAAFYGYFYSLFGRQAAGGHLGIEKVLSSPWIDCLCAPQSYMKQHRQMGGTGQSRLLPESARLHGKLCLDEMDQPPFDDIVHPADRDMANRTAEESVAIVRRNVYAPVSRGMGMWYYDFGPESRCGWWLHPTVLESVRKTHELANGLLGKPYKPAADVLAVYDEKSFFYTANSGKLDPVTDPASVNALSTALYQSGAGFDSIYLFDLPRAELDRYRVVIFVNAYRLSDETRAFIRDRVARDGRHVVYVYAPDAVGERGADAARISRQVGMHVQRSRTTNPFAYQWRQREMDAKGSVSDLYVIFNSREDNELRCFDPVFEVDDERAEPMAWYRDTGTVMCARKREAEYTAWYMAMPVVDASALRDVLRDGGAHIYEDAGDSLLLGDYVCVHTKDGGNRRVTLRNGKVVDLYFPPRTTTFLDPETGAVVHEP